MTDQKQQQHETVTATTTTTPQSNLHKLPSVQELISPIHIAKYGLCPQRPLLGDTSDCPLHSLLPALICHDDLMWYFSWPPDASTVGTTALHLLKIGPLEH